MRAVGLTDHGTFAGAIHMLKACRSQGIKPILGMESYQARNFRAKGKEGQPDGRKGNRHINIIAKNFTGYRNLCKLSHISSIDGSYYDPRIDLELLEEHKEGLIVTSACLSNVVNANLLRDQYDKAKQAATIYKDIFGGDFYLEMMYHGLDAQAKILPDIQKLSKELDVKTIITNDCLVPGSLVSVGSGCKAIENVRAGDLVYSHNGVLRKVEYVNRRDVSEDIVVIKTSLGGIETKCTKNHPFLVISDCGPGWEKVDPINGRWVAASEINKGDILCVPRYKIATANRKDFVSHFDLSTLLGLSWATEIDGVIKSFRRDKAAGVPTQLPLDRHFFQVLGLYLAEGYIDGTVIGFGLHNREQVLKDILCSFFERYNFHPTVTRSGNGMTVRVNSFVFAYVFKKICSTKEGSKSFPDTSLLSKEEILTVLRYYFEADAHVNKNGKTCMIGSTSSSLIFRISQILQMFDIWVLPSKRDGKISSARHPNAKSEWNDLYVLNFCGQNLYRLNILLGLEYSGHRIEQRETKPKPKPKPKHHIIKDDVLLVRVSSIKSVSYKGQVINIQVEKDESFVVNGICCHNCHYLEKKDADAHEVLMCMSSGRCIKDPNRMKFPYAEFYFKSQEEMYQSWWHCPQSLLNTLEIAEKCDYSDIIFVEDGGEMRLPRFEIPPEFPDPRAYLKHLAVEGMKRLGLHKSKRHRERLAREISDIQLVYDTKRYDFATYLLIVWDIMRHAKEKGIAAGIRGSGYGSLLCKCLGISEGVDPLEQDLLWERFLGFDDRYFISESDVGMVDEYKHKVDNELEKEKKDASGVMFDRYS